MRQTITVNMMRILQPLFLAVGFLPDLVEIVALGVNDNDAGEILDRQLCHCLRAKLGINAAAPPTAAK